MRGGGDGISMKEGTCYGSHCEPPKLGPLFPLPWFSVLRPSFETLRRIAGRRPGIKPVPMRGSTEQAELFHGKRLNPAVFPPSAFINERRIFLNRRMDFVPPDEYKHMSDGGVYCEDGRTAFERAVRALKGLDFMDIEWCTAARDKSHIVIGSKVFGVWTAMTNQVIRETYEEDARRARATLAFAMTDRHLLAGEEMLAVHWDKQSDAVAFEVCSFSWPQHPVAKLLQPIVHRTQRGAVEAFCLRMQEMARARELTEGGGCADGPESRDPGVWP
uniref:DUF1990 domain-containing protein n=1 Tax=Hemiselmis andersenii TaxID=464988 RepID=A0A7S0UI05_HEMAN